MGLTEHQIFEIGGGINCQNPDCGHTPEEHPFGQKGFERPCTKCDCKSYEFLTRLLPMDNDVLESLTDDIQISNVNLEKQIDELEDKVGKPLKENELLTKKLKSKTTQNEKLKTKNKELEYRVELLKIELGLVENVKRNLKHIIDKEE